MKATPEKKDPPVRKALSGTMESRVKRTTTGAKNGCER